ncbi:MAG: M3 family oligoendopeptidase [Anaerofustis sp.]
MKFSEYSYKRVDFNEVFERTNQILTDMKNAPDFESFKSSVLSFNTILRRVHSASIITSIRNSIDTTDPFYDAEQQYYDRSMPEFEERIIGYFQTMLDSPYHKEISETWGSYILDRAKSAVSAFCPEAIELMKEENLLVSEYQKLLAGAKIPFQGEIYNLSSIMKFFQSDDRNVRKNAYEKFSDFLKEKEESFDSLYDRLVSVRTQIAKAAGYNTYTAFGYNRLTRTDYSMEDVAVFRRQVEETLVPICTKIREDQAKRIGVDHLKFYDHQYLFSDGNAVPVGNEEMLVGIASDMYADMSSETKEFFSFMTEHGLMDLSSKTGKAPGGYCTYIAEESSPFIFSNFNGTSGDVDVLTHEAGHALQAYCSRGYELYHYMEPTYEACEIHSMSMEYFAYPYMSRFFGDSEAKYRYAHLSDALTFIPYAACVDHFQQEVYENPRMTPLQRKEMWRSLEKRYLPHIDYDGNEEMEKGVYWFRQLHIFMLPFYYIDYALASVHAMEFYQRMQTDRTSAWKDYMHLCTLGGSLSYLSLLKEGHLHNPFESGTLDTIVVPLVRELNQ